MFLKRVVMSLLKYIERLRRIDYMISMMSTGTPEEFAEKLGINKNISLVIASGGFTLTNYLGNKLWTFRKIKAKIG